MSAAYPAGFVSVAMPMVSIEWPTASPSWQDASSMMVAGWAPVPVATFGWPAMGWTPGTEAPAEEGNLAQEGDPVQEPRGRSGRRRGRRAAKKASQLAAGGLAEQTDGLVLMPMLGTTWLTDFGQGVIYSGTESWLSESNLQNQNVIDQSAHVTLVEPPQVGTWIRRKQDDQDDEETTSQGKEEDDLASSETHLDSPSAASGGTMLGSFSDLTEELGEPLELAENAERASDVMTKLEEGSILECQQIVDWLLEAALSLSLSKIGTRVIQKALDHASAQGRDKLVSVLIPYTIDLLESPHGNHVLTKIVEKMPSASIGPVIKSLQEKGATFVARHRFGCRVLERLTEHCSGIEISSILDQIVFDAEALSRHCYGNFVIQHLLEYGHRRNDIVSCLLPYVPQLAMHRTASHVVQRALDCGDERQQHAIIVALMHGQAPNTLLQIACSRYGSFVAEQLPAFRRLSEVQEVQSLFENTLSELEKSAYGRRVAERFGLQVSPISQACGDAISRAGDNGVTE